MRTLQRGVREVITDDTAAVDAADEARPEQIAIEREREAVVRTGAELIQQSFERRSAQSVQAGIPTYSRSAYGRSRQCEGEVPPDQPGGGAYARRLNGGRGVSHRGRSGKE
jgi:hypothetical protein